MRPVSCLHALDLGELGEAGHARLVAHHVLAVPHRGDRDLGALGRDGRGQDHAGSTGPRGWRGGRRRAWPADTSRANGGGEVVLVGVEGDERRALAQQAVDLPVDVAVVEADGGELMVMRSLEDLAFHTGRGDALDEQALEEQEEHEDRHERQDDMANRPPQSTLAGGVDEGAERQHHGVGASCR